MLFAKPLSYDEAVSATGSKCQYIKTSDGIGFSDNDKLVEDIKINSKTKFLLSKGWKIINYVAYREGGAKAGKKRNFFSLGKVYEVIIRKK